MISFRSSHSLYTVLPHLTSTFLNSYHPQYFFSPAVQEKSHSLVFPQMSLLHIIHFGQYINAFCTVEVADYDGRWKS